MNADKKYTQIFADGIQPHLRESASRSAHIGAWLAVARHVMQYVIDPKPDELALGRVKFSERRMEARTGWLFKTFG